MALHRFARLPGALSVVVCCLLAANFLLAQTGENASDSTSSSRDQSRLNEIEQLLDDGVYVEAARKLENYLADNPADITARRQLARAYVETENHTRLQFHANAILRSDPEDEEAREWSELAEEKIKENFPKARAELEEALEREPDNESLRQRLIELLISRGRNEEALRHLETILEEDPDDPERWLDYARNLSWMERYDESLKAYARYLDIADEPGGVQLEIARVLAWSGDHGSAATRLKAYIEENPDDLDARALLGNLYRWNDDTQAAATLYRYVLDEDSDHPGALAGMKELERIEERRARQADTLDIEAMERRVEEMPGDWEARLQLARLYGATDRYGDAIGAFAAYVKANPDDVPVRREYAFALSMEERYDEAIEQLREYLVHYPDDISSQLRIVNLLMWQGEFNAAREELLEILEKSPKHPEVLWHLARIHHMNEEWDEALKYYRAIRKHAPKFDVARARIRQIEAHPRYRLNRLEETVENNPEAIGARIELAESFLELERYYEAQEQAEAVLDIDEANSRARRITRQADDGIERLREERAKELHARLQKDPSDLDAALELARLLKAEGQASESLPYFRHYISNKPNDLEVRREYAQALSWLPEHHREATRELEILLDQEPDSTELRLLRLELLAQMDAMNADDREELREIEDGLDSALASNPRDFEAQFQMGRLQQIRENWSGALERYREAIRIGGDDEETRERIEAIRNLPEFEIAEQKERIEESPNDLELRMELAEMLFEYERYSAAREQAQAILEINSRHSEARRIARYASDLIERQRGEEIRQLREHLRRRPRDLDTHLELGRMLMQDGSLAEARQRYRLYLRTYFHDIEARREYAELLSWMDGHYDEAVDEYRQLVNFHPDDLELRLQFARLLSWDRRGWEEAEEVLKELALYQPDNPEIQLLRADLHRYQGRYDEARHLYEDVMVAQRRGLPGYYPARPSAVRFNADKGRLPPLRGARAPSFRETRSRQDREAAGSDSSASEDSGLPPPPRAIANHRPLDDAPRPRRNSAFSASIADNRPPPPPDGMDDRRNERPRRSEASRARYEDKDRSPLPESRSLPLPDGSPDSRSRERRSQNNPRYAAPDAAMRAPVAASGGNFGGPSTRQFGDVSRPSRASRSSERLPPLDAGIVSASPSKSADAYEQAKEGVEAIDQQLRPQLMGFLGFESDSDDFSGSRIGARYNHFLSDGARLQLGLTRFEFKEDDLTPEDSVSATALSLGITGRLSDRTTGSAEITGTRYSDGPGTTVSGTLGASFEVDPVNTVSFEYAKYDLVHEVKTVRSLQAEIDADRARLLWASRPPPEVEDKPFEERLFFEGNLSYASFSDDNEELAYLLRPYFRLKDEPSLDLVAGWRGLSYSDESPNYWSPSSYNGPLFGARLAGDMFWEINYDLRFEVFFPTGAGQTSRSLSLDLRRDFTQNLSGGMNFFVIESPRENDADYHYTAFLFDLLWKF